MSGSGDRSKEVIGGCGTSVLVKVARKFDDDGPAWGLPREFGLGVNVRESRMMKSSSLDERLIRAERSIVDVPSTEEHFMWDVSGLWVFTSKWYTESWNMKTHLGVGDLWSLSPCRRDDVGNLHVFSGPEDFNGYGYVFVPSAHDALPHMFVEFGWNWRFCFVL